MSVRAATTFGTIQVRTHIKFFQSLQISGQTPNHIPSPGSQISVELANNSQVNINILSANQNKIVFEYHGQEWTMTPWSSNDVPVSITMRGMSSDDWVVRSVVPLK